VEIGNELVTIENVVQVNLGLALLLFTEGPDGARNQSSLVIWLLWHLNTRVWLLDCTAEAVPPPLLIFLMVDHILIVVGVAPRDCLHPCGTPLSISLLEASLCWPRKF
jgi:hypothetical protein